MEIRDIVNREVINLQNCDQEPIHIPGSIQPHGCLFAVHDLNGTIDYASANTAEFTGLVFSSLLGKNFNALFCPETESAVSSPIVRCRLTVNGQKMEGMVHRSGDYSIYELETQNQDSPNPDLLELSNEFVGYIENTSTIKELCGVVAGGIRKITGYDRVMIYRFDEQYNGEVIAEARDENLEPFLGLHYPHTDIPVQARALYIRNQIRMITDVHYEPVPIYTRNAAGQDVPLDLGLAQLRSVSPIHCQYLINMGVGATLTISLVNKGRLWGLVACHHYSPRFLSYQIRMAAKLAGHLITSQIETRRISEEHHIFYAASQVTEELFAGIKDFSEGSPALLFSSGAILKVCNAAGAALVFNDRFYAAGQVPPEELVKQCIDELELTERGVLRSHCLAQVLPSLPTLTKEFPGLLYFPLNRSGDAMLWFRKETVSEVHWAGDPAKAIEKDKNGLSPRKSFALWKEMVTSQSKSWLEPEFEAASRFVNQLEKQLSAIVISSEEDKQRSLAIALQETNDELENVNWISTHDLQEPLRKIQMLASLLLDEDGWGTEEERREKIRKMDHFAGRMQKLIRDIIQYNKLGHANRTTETVDLAAMLEGLKPEVHELAEDTQLLIQGPLAKVQGTPWLLRQLFLNLITNSIRFRKEGEPARIEIEEIPFSESPKPDDTAAYTVIRYTDHGIGFDPKHNEHVFRIFSRLGETRNTTQGTGIGLALCRKVMQSHKGYIRAEGDPGVGVKFYMYFPKP